MRPHLLRLRAFGPFAGEVEVDLDALAAGGLFLLHGPTGAGKTTLLDAMCFALFGSVPGVRGTRRLRSDHAAPDARCSVTLELTVAGRRLRVTRTPSFERPKKRGEGCVTEQATIRVEERRGSQWVTWSTRPGEADGQIAELVGMNAEQFCRVVLLPQGQFAAFLHADAAARTELLERLFSTARFRDAETWLADRRRALDAQLAAAGADLRALLARIAQVASVELPEADPAGWYAQTLQDLADGLAVARADAVGAAAAADASAALHLTMSRRAEAQVRRQEATEALRELAAGEPAASAARQALSAAALAAPLVPLVDRADRVQETARAAGEAADVAALAAGLTGAGLEALRSAADAEHLRSARLEALGPQAHRVAAAEAAAAAAEQDLAVARARLEAIATQRGALPTLRTAAVQVLADATLAIGAMPVAQARAETLTELAADVAHREELTSILVRARGEETDAREGALTAHERELALRTAQLSGQAARLALLLVDGDPCAVCGATEHPRPAHGGGDVPGDEALAVAGAHRQDADRLRSEAAARVAGLVAELRVVADRTEASGWADASGLPAACLDADAAVVLLRERAAGVEDATAAVAAYDELAAGLDAEHARQTERAATAAAAVTHARATVEVESAALAGALGGAADLDAARTASLARAAALDVAAVAAAEAVRSTQEAQEATSALLEALAGCGLEDVAAVHGAALDRVTREALGGQLAAYDAALAAALAVPELALPDGPPVDLAASGADADERANVREHLAAAAAVLADRYAQLVALGPAVRSAVSDLAPLTAAHREVTGVADLARGANPRGMRLSTYVLAARLEQVAAAASSRLVVMTDGRYTIRHTDVRPDKRTRGGLGLEVCDGWTGTVRDTGTLSGGETFLASLALALGLADTVTAEAGGAPIEALFVDEGFGSLDEDTLEEVMDVLDALRTGGRVVGIVSHVADLRRRIPVQLQVHKAQTGSRLEVLGA
jgi:exonuclease SbcC